MGRTYENILYFPSPYLTGLASARGKRVRFGFHPGFDSLVVGVLFLSVPAAPVFSCIPIGE
jgi:hypothetical protein